MIRRLIVFAVLLFTAKLAHADSFDARGWT